MKGGASLQDEQKILTPDELRKMVGQPIWIQPPDIPEYGRWGILESVSEDGTVLSLKGDFTCHEYGRVWECPKNPPVEAEK